MRQDHQTWGLSSTGVTREPAASMKLSDLGMPMKKSKWGQSFESLQDGDPVVTMKKQIHFTKKIYKQEENISNK